MVVLVTGCRPKEAAYIVHSKSLRQNEYLVKHMEHTYEAFCPASDTKTDRDYLWLIPVEYDRLVDRILTLPYTGFHSYEKLAASMKPFYSLQVLQKVKGVKTRHSRTKWYCMRTARAFRATEWIKLVTEYRLMGWSPEPLNPLQHVGDKMTLEHYATRGIDSQWEVQKRCCVKYAGDEEKRQEWMAPWMEKNKDVTGGRKRSH